MTEKVDGFCVLPDGALSPYAANATYLNLCLLEKLRPLKQSEQDTKSTLGAFLAKNIPLEDTSDLSV